MQNLNSIPVVGTFMDVASRANNNFLAIKTAIDALELSVTRSKGFFSSGSALSTRYPSPVVGDWAVVQVTENNVTQNIIYQCATAGAWVSTNTVWPGGAVDLSEYVQIASIEDEPINDNENPISSGGAWNLKKDVYSEVGKELRYGVSISNQVSTKLFEMPYDAATHTCTVSSQKDNTSANQKYRVNYFPQTFSKGDIIHFHGESSAQKQQNLGFTTEDPSQRASLAGLVVDNAFHHHNVLPETIHDYDIIVPYDGAYLVYYYHTDNWVSGTRSWTYYPKGGVKEKAATAELGVATITDAIIKADAVGTKTVTLIPAASETYNLYFRSGQANAFSQSDQYQKRLCYFPKQRIAGGGTITIKYTGLNTIDVFQMKEKESVTLDTVPKDVYTKAEVTTLPQKTYRSNQSDEFTNDTNTAYDSQLGTYVRTVSFVAHKDCSRIAIIMGSTQAATTVPADIVNNIVEISLPVFDTDNIDLRRFAKAADLNELEVRVSENEISTTITPAITTVKKYEMAANGVISKKSSSNYKFVYVREPFPVGTIIHFRGTTDGTSRANRFAFVKTDPATVANPAALSPVDEVIELTLDEIGYDDDGNVVSRSYSKDITVTEEEVWLVYYYYNKNWLIRTFSITYPGALKSEIDNIDEYRSGVDKLIGQAKLWKDSANTTLESLGLIHFSDIHGDTVAANKIAEWLDKYGDYVDELVNTGDVVYYDVDSGNNTSWWNNCGLADKSLFVLGNHDCATKNATEYDQKEAQSGGRAWNGKGKAWGHNTFFSPHLSEWDVTPPTGFNDSSSQHYKACYWHKDYEESKVRIIGLDCMNYFDGVLDENLNIVTPGFKNPDNIGQEVWFAEKLAEAKTAGYSVVILCHYPLDDTDATPGVSHANVLDANGCNTSPDGGFVMNRLTGETTVFTREWAADTTAIDADKRFCLRNKIGEGTFDPANTWVNYTKGDTNNIGDILQRFIDGGGKFVVWLCGHYHGYHMFYPKKYPSVLTVVAGEAGNERAIYWANRPKNIPHLRTLANYIAIDTYYGWLKLIRLGISTDRTLRSVKYLCYDYRNKKVMSEG